jgi:hypothetical protein
MYHSAISDSAFTDEKLPQGYAPRFGSYNDSIPHTQVPLAPASHRLPSETSLLVDYLGQLSLALTNQINLTRAPSVEPTVFTGENPLDFPEWLSNFEGLLHTNCIPESERMRYLQKYTAGEAKEAIKGFFWLPPTRAFAESFAILKERYNDPFALACNYRQTLNSWPKIGGSDSAALRRFVDFMKQLATAKTVLSDLSILDDELENRKIAEKLPDWLRLRWNRISHRTKRINHAFPGFVDFVAFLIEEDGIANAPLAKPSGMDKHKQDPPQPKQKGRSLATTQKPQPTAVSTELVQTQPQTPSVSSPPPYFVPTLQTPVSHCLPPQSAITLSTSATANKPDSRDSTKKAPYCYFCQESHYLNSCDSLIAAPLDKRKDFLQKPARCLSCLSTRHFVAECKWQKTCNKCQGKHHTAFHDVDPARPSD